jgi:hypothetical protein
VSKYSGWRNADGALQRRLLGIVDSKAHQGLTSREAYAYFDTRPNHPEFAHHGWISGALSLLHADLKIIRLADKREGVKIYVTPDFIDSRQCEVQGRGGPGKDVVQFLQSVDEFLAYWMEVDQAGAKFKTDRTRAERNNPLYFRELRALWADRPET